MEESTIAPTTTFGTTSQLVGEPHHPDQPQGQGQWGEQEDTKVDVLLAQYELGVAEIPPPSPHFLGGTTLPLLEEQAHKGTMDIRGEQATEASQLEEEETISTPCDVHTQ